MDVTMAMGDEQLPETVELQNIALEDTIRINYSWYFLLRLWFVMLNKQGTMQCETTTNGKRIYNYTISI